VVMQLGADAESAEAKSFDRHSLSDKQAARYINMSQSWLRQSRMAGRTDGPVFLRIGSRTIRYLRADLERWLERRRCPNSETQAELATHLGSIDARPHSATPRQPPARRTRRRRKHRGSSDDI
jgi:predicted DNA-binding transcriptional regulator AlpA